MCALTCSRCGELRPIDEFAWKLKAAGRRDGWCRSCRKTYSRTYYEAHRARYAELDAARKHRLRLERTELLLEYFATNARVDRGERDPVVLEFDHLRDKSFNIGSKLTHCSWAKVLAGDREVRGRLRELPPAATSARRGALRTMLTTR